MQAVERLNSELGAEHVRTASWLHSFANLSAASAQMLNLEAAKPGRRLLEHVGHYILWGTLTKVCFFLLDYPRLVFLDLDVVLMRPIDSLLAMRMPANTYMAAVGVGGACPRVVSWEPFNGGVRAAPHSP